MARYRCIKPEFWEDTKMAELTFGARLFYISLWNFADDDGLITADPRFLKCKCFPYDKVSIARLLNELLKIDRIEIKNNIIKIKNFLKHQKIDKPKESELRRQFDDNSTNDRRVLSLELNREEENRKEKKKAESVFLTTQPEGPSSPPIPPPPSPFDFFDKYPTRNGTKGSKKKARDEWGKLSPDERYLAQEAITKQKAHYDRCKAQRLFVSEFPDCFRWLKDRRWEDELGPPVEDSFHEVHLE